MKMTKNFKKYTKYIINGYVYIEITQIDTHLLMSYAER